ncbi:MAG TPA: uracil-DNA glycosylase, partial [Bacteroidales bacterium]|nr:uracil-DNA glycosylase [Bacteroidales bacterium]
MGNPSAGVLIIGEGPGQQEDEQGLPFVGRSGQLLDKILEACGFNRNEHVFIGNIVKCRPPENRDPKPDEREACIGYLFKQIDFMQPKIIVLLGRTALQGLIDPQLSITRLRGTWLEWNGIQVLPTYHPSALLR